MAAVSGNRGTSDGRALQRDVISRADGQVISLAQVAERLGVSKDTVAEHVRDGAFPGAFKLGTLWRIPAAPFEAIVRGWWCPAAGSFDDWHAALVAGSGQQPPVADT